MLWISCRWETPGTAEVTLETLIHTTLSYLDLSTTFSPSIHPRLCKQYNNINKSKEAQQKGPGFMVMLQVSWATAGQGRSQCCLHKAKNTTWVQVKDWAFMRGQTQRAAAQGLEFRNIHISAAAMRQGSKWQKVITKGTFHCTGSGELQARQGGGWKYPACQNSGSHSPGHTLMCNTYTESSLLLRLFSP